MGPEPSSVFVKSDRSGQRGDVGSNDRQDVGQGQRLTLPYQPGAVRTHEHQPSPDRGCGRSSRTTAVRTHEQNQSRQWNDNLPSRLIMKHDHDASYGGSYGDDQED